jgi:hypothetical protein
MKTHIYHSADGTIQQVLHASDDAEPIPLADYTVLVLDGSVLVAGKRVQAGELVAFVRVPTLEELQAAKWEDIKRSRDLIEFGSFTWDGSVFDADPVSTSRIMGAFSLALAAKMVAQPFSIDWTLKDNTVRTLSADEMIAVGSTLGAIVKQAHETAGALRTSIDQAADEATLETITWPA